MTRLILESHRVELEEMEQAMVHAESWPEQTEAYGKFLEAHPDAVRWLLPASMLVIAGGLACLAAIVCGLIAMRRLQRRSLAVAALVIAGFVPVFFCCGGLLG